MGRAWPPWVATLPLACSPQQRARARARAGRGQGPVSASVSGVAAAAAACASEPEAESGPGSEDAGENEDAGEGGALPAAGQGSRRRRRAASLAAPSTRPQRTHLRQRTQRRTQRKTHQPVRVTRHFHRGGVAAGGRAGVHLDDACGARDGRGARVGGLGWSPTPGLARAATQPRRRFVAWPAAARPGGGRWRPAPCPTHVCASGPNPTHVQHENTKNTISHTSCLAQCLVPPPPLFSLTRTASMAAVAARCASLSA